MNLYIVGAGGMGREIYSWLSQEIATNKKDFHIRGFLDDNPNALANYNYPIKVICSVDNYLPQKGDSLVIAIMEPETKKKVTDALTKKGANFYTLIHPSITIGTNVKIGKGCVIAPNCALTNDIIIENFVFINIYSGAGHDVRIGKYTSINSRVSITGNVHIGEQCLCGVGARVIPNIKIGDKAVIGAGSIVIRNVPNNTTVFGNPARKIDRI